MTKKYVIARRQSRRGNPVLLDTLNICVIDIYNTIKQELEPTKKCLESLRSKTAIITSSNEPTDILKAMEQANK